MDSGAKNVESDKDTATKQVLNYYKKYSQNKQLPKYFSGSPVSYLPEIKDENEVTIVVPKIYEIPADIEQTDTSRASSAMSNRKLEWDNGADIGYENMQDVKILRKSVSLPAITDAKQSDADLDIITQLDRARSEGSSDSNVKIILLTFSSSSEALNPDSINVYSSSSSSPKEGRNLSPYSSNTDSIPLSKKTDLTISPSEESCDKEKIVQFASSLSFLKQKIGLPEAHSTPKYVEARKSDPELFSSTNLQKPVKSDETSKSDNDLHQVNKFDQSKGILLSKGESLPEVLSKHKDYKEERSSGNSVKGHISTYKNSKVVNLAITNPVTVECISSPKPKKKSVQEIAKHLSVGVQTENIPERELIQIIQKSGENNQNQSLIFVDYSESDKTNCGVQTSSDMTSHCDSFEYYKNSDSDKNKQPTLELVDNGLPNTRQEEPTELKESPKTIDDQSSSSDICLGNVISATQLDNNGDAVENSIHLLHKLLKSKKYDPATKKRYIKKIMQKISNSRYLEESSNSSDLFCPKRVTTDDLKHFKPVRSDSSDQDSPQSILQLNVPLYLALSEKQKSPRKKKLGMKTFTQEFLPKERQSFHDENSSPPEIIPVDLRDNKKLNCFTLTNNEFSLKRDQLNKEKRVYEMQPHKTYETEVSLEKQYESSSTSKSPTYQNWREDKTLSEKLLEGKSGKLDGEGDCVVRFAEKERAYQINWINNEISHLGKLKGLLEKPAGLSKLNEQFQGIKKTTTVYTVSEEHAQTSMKGVKFKRNFVIETNLGTDSNVPVTFQLQGKKYSVNNLTAANPLNNNRQIIGDIEVESSDSTTSIKISTFCEACKRSPCSCPCPKCKRTSCTCNKLKPAICRKCHTIPCVCKSKLSSKHHEHCLLDEKFCWRCNKFPCQCTKRAVSPSRASTVSGKTICLRCHRTPCVCSGVRTGRNVFSKTCLSCGRYPCIHGKSKTSGISDDYAGTFIVAHPPISAIGNTNMGKKKCATFPRTSKEETDRKCSACKIIPCICDVLDQVQEKCTPCGECPCTCETTKSEVPKTCSECGQCSCVCKVNNKSPESCSICNKNPCACECRNTDTKVDKKCSVCGRCPCLCETIRREYLNRGKSISSKLMDRCETCRKYPCICKLKSSIKLPEKCDVCGKCPCICKLLEASSKQDEYCSICGKIPCACVTIRREYLSRGTSVSRKSLQHCPDCKKTSCMCDKQEFYTQGTSMSSKSLGACSACGKCPCLCKTLSKNSTLSSKNSAESRTSSLKKMLDNCNCSTQTSCKCDFVDKLVKRFNKTEACGSGLLKMSRSKSFQTEEDKCTCHVGVQTQVDKKHQILQTPNELCNAENKRSQTQRCCQNAAIQTAHIAHQVISGSGDEEGMNRGVNFIDKLKITRSSTLHENKVDVGCVCETNQGTQTLGEKRVILTCSSQSEGSRPVTPIECVCSHSAGISRLRKKKKVSKSADNRCTCCKGKIKPKTITIEQYESKTESLGSDTRYTMSSTSVVTTSHGNTESASDPLSGTPISCVCCKKKYPADEISMLGTAEQNIPLCCHCVCRRPILTSLCYAGPEHICTCYKPVRKDVLHGIKKTVNELYDLEFCTCTTPSRSKNNQYCTHCLMKLKHTARTKNGIAYTLTLEEKSPHKEKRQRKKIKKSSLEEIRIKIPCPYNKKVQKDKINLCRQDGDKEGVSVGFVECITTESNHRKSPKVKVICSKTRRSRRSQLTLQDYLKKNKPDFIQCAEGRRQTLFESRSERELKKDEAKLRFFEDSRCYCKKLKKQNTKLFTDQEMKAITKRNYAKLPEVQQKNNALRTQRLRNADKFIVDVFSTKVRSAALKGKKDFPLSQNIVCLPKA